MRSVKRRERERERELWLREDMWKVENVETMSKRERAMDDGKQERRKGKGRKKGGRWAKIATRKTFCKAEKSLERERRKETSVEVGGIRKVEKVEKLILQSERIPLFKCKV